MIRKRDEHYQREGDGIFISVVIPTYNRARKIFDAIRSVYDTFDGKVSYEVVVIDDASTDNTEYALRAAFTNEIEAEHLRILVNSENIGVTGSRNAGYNASRGEWILCLDSDDELISDVSEEILSTLKENRDRAIVFLRCIDDCGKFVGRAFKKDIKLDLRTYLEHTSYGEVLVALNKRLVASPPFVEELRGYEGLCFSRIIRDYGPALLSTVVARRYDRRGGDRLSSFRGFCDRMPLLSRGHFAMVSEFYQYMSIRRISTYMLKAGVYMLGGIAFHIFGGKNTK